MVLPRVLVHTAHGTRSGGLPVVGVNTASGIRVAIGATSTQSAALDAGVYYVGNSVPCFIAIGANPTAVDSGASLPLFGASLLPLVVLEDEKFAVIRNGTTDGYLYIVPIRVS